MTRQEIQQRIAELDREINNQVAGAKLPPATKRRTFPIWTWLLAGLALGWTYYGHEIPGTQDIHSQYHNIGLYVAIFFGVLALWATVLWLIQPSTKITPEYRASAEKVKLLQEERRDLMSQLKRLES